MIGVSQEFAAYFVITAELGISVSYTIIDKEKEIVIMLGGVIPLIITLYAELTVGIDAAISMSFGKDFGYEPVYMKIGTEYTPSNGWIFLTDTPTDFTLSNKRFGSKISDSEECFKLSIAPNINLVLGVVFSKLIDMHFDFYLALPMALTWPETCSSTKACALDPTQLKATVDFEFDVTFGIDIGSNDFDLTFFSEVYPLFSTTVPIASSCTDLDLGFLKYICCVNGEAQYSRAPTPAPQPTEPRGYDDCNMPQWEGLTAVPFTCVTNFGFKKYDR
eukprot:1014971_1